MSDHASPDTLTLVCAWLDICDDANEMDEAEMSELLKAARPLMQKFAAQLAGPAREPQWQPIVTTTETYGPCRECGGSGRIYAHEMTSPWWTCHRCGGSGQIVTSRTMSHRADYTLAPVGPSPTTEPQG